MAIPSVVELLQNLIRFDTTNPPGNETACITYIKDVLAEAGIESTILARTPSRANLVARIAGEGTAAPLMLYGHVDVVTTKGQQWTHPPFSGDLIDGYVWGRGALDMKGGVAMMLSAFLRAKTEGLALPGDLLFTALCDEETRSDFGVNHLVENEATYFKNVRYAIGEFGGFTLYIGGKKFYPIQVSEKQICHVRATIRGPGGHGSMVHRGGAMARLGSVLTKLDRAVLPLHLTTVARTMVMTIADNLPFPTGMMIKQLLNPALSNSVLRRLGPQAALFGPVLRNNVNATIVYGGEKFNVIPSEIILELDTRLLPGCSADDILTELRSIIGRDAELEVIKLFPRVHAEPDMGLFATLAGAIKETDPQAIPVPFLLPATTDASVFTKLGIQTYGFLPTQLPPDLDFWKMVHGADERIPVDSLLFGAETIYRVLQKLK
jgi:acetylornithine deacetylase/succinyl-diaminopimelate desuccinylase-like protein